MDTILSLAGFSAHGRPESRPDAGRRCILCTLLYVRWLADLTRRLAGRWCGIPIVPPVPAHPAAGGLDFGPTAGVARHRPGDLAGPALAARQRAHRHACWSSCRSRWCSTGSVFTILPALGVPVAGICPMSARSPRRTPLAGLAVSP